MRQARGLIPLGLLLSNLLMAQTSGALAISHARIVTVSGQVLADGTVIVRDGLIEAVGENIAPPADAWIVEGKGLTVYPGLMDALSTWGLPDAAPAAPAAARGGGRPALATPAAPAPTAPAAPPVPPARGPEDRPNTTPWLMAADQLQPKERRAEDARNAGFTSAITFPTRGIFAGEGAVINLAGDKPQQMVVQSPAGLYLTLQPNGFTGGFPSALFGVIAYIRQIYLDADHYKLAKETYARSPLGQKRPEYDRALEAVLSAPRILLPAVRAVELERMVRFGQELKQPYLLYGAHEAYRVADRLKQAGTPVLVSLKWPEAARDGDPEDVDSLRTLKLRAEAPRTPAVLQKAGVPFALYSDGIATQDDIRKAVRRAITAGLAHDDAVKAMTLNPAQLFGIADRLGSIEKGKIANLVVTRGNLFDEKTKVEYVIVDGIKYEPVTSEPPAAPAGRPTGGRE